MRRGWPTLDEHRDRAPRPGGPTLEQAVTAFVATIAATSTRRAYTATFIALAGRFDPELPLGDLAGRADELAHWFTDRWGGRSAATWNRNLDALRSAARYWAEQGWLVGDDPTVRLRRRRRPADRSRALDRAAVEALLARPELELRERVLWRMLYESAARTDEVLSLDVNELDLPNRRAKVRRKAGAVDIITWRTGTARLLPRLLAGRRTGPVFLTERRARVALPPGDLDPASGRARISYRRAAEVLETATADEPGGPWTLHQFRHSALTHAAEDGASTAVLLAYSGHTSVASLARYARVSPEALGRWQSGRAPAARRRPPAN